jgi:hypothetical protein
MKDQNDSWNEALNLVIESVLKPDFELREFAHEEFCYNELMQIREQTVNYLKSLRK